MAARGRILVLWNQTEEDVYERWRREGPKPLPWDPTRLTPDVGTVYEELEAMLEALREGGFDVRCVNVDDDIDRLIGAIRFHRPDAVFNLIEYFNEDNAMETAVVGLYDLFGTPYTGSSARALILCQDKYRTKVLLDAAGIPTPEFIRVATEPVPDPEEYGLTYPLIVKPSLEDASGGIEPASVVHSYAQLEERVRHALREFEQAMVVEEYIEGREIHAALLGNRPPEVLPLFEMEFDDSEFNPEGEWRPQIISFKAKWDPHSQVFYSMDAVVPAQDLDEEVEARIREIAVRAFQTMECRDYARIDMRVDEEGEVYVLEVNPNPDLADGAAYMQCGTGSGRTFSEALCEIADMAIERGREWERKAAERGDQPLDQLLLEYTQGPAAAQAGAEEGPGQARAAEPGGAAGGASELGVERGSRAGEGSGGGSAGHGEPSGRDQQEARGPAEGAREGAGASEGDEDEWEDEEDEDEEWEEDEEWDEDEEDEWEEDEEDEGEEDEWEDEEDEDEEWEEDSTSAEGEGDDDWEVDPEVAGEGGGEVEVEPSEEVRAERARGGAGEGGARDGAEGERAEGRGASRGNLDEGSAGDERPSTERREKR